MFIQEPDDSEKEGEENDKDFSAAENSTDDEDTIMEQEKQEKNQDHKKEIDELNVMSICCGVLFLSDVNLSLIFFRRKTK